MKNRDSIKTIILGIGNILLGDEGIGVHTINKLKKEKLPSTVLLVDGSTAGFRLLTILETYKDCKFIIIDALELSDTSLHNLAYDTISIKNKKNISTIGDIYLIPLEDLYNITDSQNHSIDIISFHQTGLIDVLKLFNLIHHDRINGYLVGINIGKNNKLDKTLALSMKLSPAIERKIPEIIKLIKKYI